MAINWSEINWSDAVKSVRGFGDKYNWSFNLTNYPSIENMTKLNVSDPTNASKYYFTPISDYWIALMGSWFYVFIIYFTCGIIYIKSKSIYPTTLAMLLMAILVAVPATTGTLYVPYEVLITLYVSAVLALAGVLYSLFVGRDRG